MRNPTPVIGEWYRHPGGESFEVVAIDPDDRTIEIQYFDGTVEELDVDQWRGEPIEAAEAPEDWTGSGSSRCRLPAGAIRCASWTAVKSAATRRSNCPSRPTNSSATEPIPGAAPGGHRPRQGVRSESAISCCSAVRRN